MHLETGLALEKERLWTEQAIIEMEREVISCFLPHNKGRDVCAHYRGEDGKEHEIVITCEPFETKKTITEKVHNAIAKAA